MIPAGKRKFTPEEDELLKRLVEEYGQNWEVISTKMESRLPRQAKERWYHYLRPDVRRDAWTREEEKELIQLVRESGRSWKSYENYFPGRTDVAIKNHYNFLKRNLDRIKLARRKAHAQKVREAAKQIVMPEIKLEHDQSQNEVNELLYFDEIFETNCFEEFEEF